METNVDRGIWAIVVILVGAMLAGLMAILFPNMVSDINDRFIEIILPEEVLAQNKKDNIIGKAESLGYFESEKGNPVVNIPTFSFDELGHQFNLVKNGADGSSFNLFNTSRTYETSVHPIFGEQKMSVFSTTETAKSLVRRTGIITEENVPYTFSFWARTVDPGKKGNIQFDIADNYENTEHREVTNQWKKYTVTSTRDHLTEEHQWYDFVDIAMRTANLKVQASHFTVKKNDNVANWTPSPYDFTGDTSNFRYLKSEGDTIYSQQFNHQGDSTKQMKIKNNSSQPMYVNGQRINGHEYKELRWKDDVSKISITSPTGLDAVISDMIMLPA